MVVVMKLVWAWRTRQPRPDWAVVCVGVPLCAVGSALALAFPASDGFAVSAGVLRAFVLALTELWMFLALSRRRAATFHVMVGAGSVCLATLTLGFLVAEMPRLLGKSLFHPLEFASLVIPSALLSYGSAVSAVEFVRLASVVDLVACVSVVNACVLAFFAFPPGTPRNERPSLAAAIFGTVFVVVGWIVMARGSGGDVRAGGGGASETAESLTLVIGSLPTKAGVTDTTKGAVDLGDDDDDEEIAKGASEIDESAWLLRSDGADEPSAVEVNPVFLRRS